MGNAVRARAEKKTEIQKILESDEPLFIARGCVWKKVGEDGAFWKCDLVKEGTSFADRPHRVWMLPYLESITAAPSVLFKLPEYRESTGSSADATSRILIEGASTDPLQAENPKERFLRAANQARANASVQFREWQYLPLLRALELPFPRLLIADDVGLGKTTEAGLVLQHLANVGRAERILIICPAHLCEKWRQEMQDRFGLAFEVFDRDVRHRLTRKGVRNPWATAERIIVSMDFAKRFENLKPISRVEFDCVVVDECHHYMTGERSSANRLRELAESICLQAPSLLLLSATPFRGGTDEFVGLLELLDPLAGERDEDGEPTPEARELWSRLVVRRIKRDLPDAKDFPSRTVNDLRVSPTSKLEKAAVAQLRVFLDTLLSDPSNQAPQLLAEIYQKRASSSWSALNETLLKTSADGGTLEGKSAEAAKPLLATLSKLVPAQSEQAKFAAFREYVASLLNQKKRIVVFSEYVDTIDALSALLQREFKKCSFGCITGSEAWAVVDGHAFAPGEIQRHHLEEHFSKPEGLIEVLLCTDTCSEGIDLQARCHNLIHFELPWSLVKMEQRNGRIDRFGQTHPPRVTNLVFDSDATKDQDILARIGQRLEQARKHLGSVSILIEESEEHARTLQESLRKGDDSLVKVTEAFESSDGVRKAEEALGHAAGHPWLSELASLAAPETWEVNALVARLVLQDSNGFLKPSGTDGVFFLHLPSEWQNDDILSGMEPSSERSPWHVVFHPERARALESALRQKTLGASEPEKHFVFLNSTHPVMEMMRRRHKLKLFSEGSVPLVKSAALKEQRSALVCEATLTSKGDRGVVLWRYPVVVDEEGDIVPPQVAKAALSTCGRVAKGDNLERSLPKESQWAKMLEFARAVATQRAQDSLASRHKEIKAQEELNRRLDRLAKEAGHGRRGDLLRKHAEARRTWVEETCLPAMSEGTDTPAVRVQPVALILRGGVK